MKRKTSFFVSNKNPLAWLMALCMVCSAVVRIVLVCVKGTDYHIPVWSQIVLPCAAALLYAIIVIFQGKERFYKTALPFWMICFYYYFLFSARDYEKYDTLILTLYIGVLLFIAILYTQISCGRTPKTSLILLLSPCPVALQIYLERAAFKVCDWHTIMPIIPNILMALGPMLLVFCIRMHPAGEYHPTWGDRIDGRKVRSLPPLNTVSPYIMVERSDAFILFEDSFEITQIERYIRKKRKEGLTSFGIMHVLLAGYCRAVCKYPAANRFISGQKIFSRGKDIQFCIAVKKNMSVDSPETVIKVHLQPGDSPEDIYRKLNEKIEDAKNTPLDSGMDNVAQLLAYIPGVVLKFAVWLLKTLDYFGLLPKFLLEISPFHGSLFFTSMGSLGIPPVYHHIYNFGNIPIFGAFGCKRVRLEPQEDGTVIQKKFIDCKFVLDERTMDGFGYATFFKHFKFIISHPNMLDTPPEQILTDID